MKMTNPPPCHVRHTVHNIRWGAIGRSVMAQGSTHIVTLSRVIYTFVDRVMTSVDYCDAATELEHEEESDEDEPEPEPERAPRWSADAAAAATAARDEQSIMARARAEAALEMQQLNAAGGVAEPEAEPEPEEQVCTEPEHESPSD